MTNYAERTAFLTQRRALLSYATSLTGDASRAEDLVQEAWLRVHGAERRGMDKITHPIRYLYRVVRNLAIDERRSAETRHVLPTDISDFGDISCDRPDPERDASSRQALAIVNRALDAMPERHRTVFILYRFQGLTMPEVGEQLHISVGLVHRIIHEVMAGCEDALYGATE